MHIPEVGRAVSELSRIIKPGGSLIVSEGNSAALEAIVIRSLKRLARKEKAEVREKPEGLEYWTEKNGDALVTRQANIRWLIKSFEAHGLTLTLRVAGQLSESYTRLSAQPLKRLVHGLNNFWFQHVRWAGPAFGNILLFQKLR